MQTTFPARAVSRSSAVVANFMQEIDANGETFTAAWFAGAPRLHLCPTDNEFAKSALVDGHISALPPR